MKLLVTYHTKQCSAEFLRRLESLGIPEIVRREQGCISYEYFLPADGSTDRLLLVEQWENTELQALHLGQPHMKRLAEIKPEYVRSTTVELIDEPQQSAGS